MINKVELKNGKVIELRSPKKGDEKELLRFINELSKEETFILIQKRKVKMKEEVEYLKNCLKEIKKGDAVHIFAFDGKKLIGNSSLERRFNHPERHVCDFGIAISKEYRGFGLGKIILEEIHKEAMKKIKGIKIFYLGVFGDNERGIYMYKKFGYKVYGKMPAGILHKGKFVDHLFMYKAIK